MPSCLRGEAEAQLPLQFKKHLQLRLPPPCLRVSVVKAVSSSRGISTIADPTAEQREDRPRAEEGRRVAGEDVFAEDHQISEVARREHTEFLFAVCGIGPAAPVEGQRAVH